MAPQDDRCGDADRDPQARKYYHVPPRLGCALSAAEVQGSQNPDVVYTQVNEHYFLFARYARSAGQTRQPGDETARAGKSTRGEPARAAITRPMPPVAPVTRTVRMRSPA